jgi:lipocalin-like protein
MNRRDILGTSAVTALGALLPGTTLAQQKTLKDQLVGSWTLVSYEATAPDGKKEQFYGPNPRGTLILDAGGRYAQIQGRPDRAKLKSLSRFDLDATQAELKALLLGFAANAGTWSVDEPTKTLVRRFEFALIPNNEGSELRAAVTLAGNELKLTQTSPVNGVKTDLVYRRA